MSRLKVFSGIGVEHWLDRYKREHRSFACPGNYIRIPAKAWIAFQEVRNKASGKRQSLYDVNREFESK